MKKICIFLLVLCLGFQSPTLPVQASGGEEETAGQEQGATQSSQIQGQNESAPSGETQGQSNGGAPASETGGQEARQRRRRSLRVPIRSCRKRRPREKNCPEKKWQSLFWEE